MRILKDFWYGNIQPADRDNVLNRRMDKFLKLVVQNKEQLIKLLSEEKRAAFQKFNDELSSVNECESFALGFRLGARFMLVVMEGMNVCNIYWGLTAPPTISRFS